MRLAITSFALMFAVAVLASPQASQSTSRDAFWDQFKAAVTKGDKQAVFALSQLPIGMSYRESSIRTRAQFMKKYAYVFAGEVNAVKCFETAKPQVDKGKTKEFYVTCPFAQNGGGDEPFVYTFKLTRSGWRFVSFENINE
ncbi:MAG TPA: hypothetical protein VN696_04635 [Pyrinomonadaceae bacterium]|nr:hypothetical protein [Pyrinomonadaceae bacterium]